MIATRSVAITRVGGGDVATVTVSAAQLLRGFVIAQPSLSGGGSAVAFVVRGQDALTGSSGAEIYLAVR